MEKKGMYYIGFGIICTNISNGVSEAMAAVVVKAAIKVT